MPFATFSPSELSHIVTALHEAAATRRADVKRIADDSRFTRIADNLATFADQLSTLAARIEDGDPDLHSVEEERRILAAWDAEVRRT